MVPRFGRCCGFDAVPTDSERFVTVTRTYWDRPRQDGFESLKVSGNVQIFARLSQPHGDSQWTFGFPGWPLR
jgi:hypothetical protein